MLDTCSLSRRVMNEEWMKVLGEHRERNKSDKWVLSRGVGAGVCGYVEGGVERGEGEGIGVS